METKRNYFYFFLFSM